MPNLSASRRVGPGRLRHALRAAMVVPDGYHLPPWPRGAGCLHHAAVQTEILFGAYPPGCSSSMNSCGNMQFMLKTLLTVAALLPGAPTDDAMAPWSTSRHPSDMAGRHVQEISDSSAEYLVVQEGTMDGRNCRSPQGVWQPFRADLGIQSLGPHGKRRRDRRRQSLAIQRPERLPQPRRDRRRGRRPGHDRPARRPAPSGGRKSSTASPRKATTTS